MENKKNCSLKVSAFSLFLNLENHFHALNLLMQFKTFIVFNVRVYVNNFRWTNNSWKFSCTHSTQRVYISAEKSLYSKVLWLVHNTHLLPSKNIYKNARRKILQKKTHTHNSLRQNVLRLSKLQDDDFVCNKYYCKGCWVALQYQRIEKKNVDEMKK